MSHLTEKELASFKEQLEKEAGELEVQLKTVSKKPEFGSDTETDFSEEADEVEEFAGDLGIQDVLKNRLQDIEAALEKINQGTFSHCENCQKEISLEVLKADPESRLCKACKAR